MPGENDGIQTVSTDRRITALKSTKVEWKLRFDGCGHYITLKSQGDIEGMNKEEAKAAYSDYSAELFTSAYVSLVKDSGAVPSIMLCFRGRMGIRLKYISATHKRLRTNT